MSPSTIPSYRDRLRPKKHPTRIEEDRRTTKRRRVIREWTGQYVIYDLLAHVVDYFGLLVEASSLPVNVRRV